jgi:trehalose 6-phosphate phosphatase
VTPTQSLEAALLIAREALQHSPAGLFTDVDGTISPIVINPADARVPHSARVALRRLRDRLDTVGVISGRAAADARRMVRVGGIRYVGNHGLEQLHGRRGIVDPAIRSHIQDIQGCIKSLANLQSLEGILMENKLATATLHYRTAPNPQDTRQTILETIARCEACQGLIVEEGRMVVNLLPRVPINKGAAITRIVEQRQLRGVVYLGDDSTDVHAFSALQELRKLALVTAAIAVGSPESPAPLLEMADAVVPDVDSAVILLAQLSAE